jgi:hypothetical protein
MFRYILSGFFIIFLFSGCVYTQENVDYSAREYKGISKDAILNAAKRVIKLSDEEFTISSKRNSISAIRAIPKNKGFTVDININELELNTTTQDDITIAKLLIKQKDDIFSENQRVLRGAVHTLFWERVEYILGLKKSWYSCSQYRVLMNFDGFFCDIKYNSNIYPTKDNIIKDTTIQKPIVIEEESINPTSIDISSMEGIILPFKNLPQEEIITIADLNTSGLFNLDENLTVINENVEKIDEVNDTIIDLNSTEDNSTNILIEDSNTTILEYIENPLPEELNMVVLDTNQSTNMVMIVDTNITTQQTQLEEIDENNTQSQNSNTTINTPEKQLSGFAKIFMESDSKNGYTINLATTYTKEQSDKFINENNLKENTFALGFINDGDNKYYVKIMYGVYKTKKEALEVVQKLPQELKVNKPTIEGVFKKQELFRKKGEDLSVK